VTDARRVEQHVNRRVELGAGADGVHKVRPVRHVKRRFLVRGLGVNVLGDRLLVRALVLRRRVDIETDAADADDAAFAVEDDAVVRLLAVKGERVPHAVGEGQDEVVEAVEDLKCVRRGAAVLHEVLAADGGHGLGLQRVAHGHHGDVHQVGAPVGDLAARVVEVPAEVVDPAVHIERLVLDPALVHVPVEALVGVLGGVRLAHADARDGRVVEREGFDAGHLANVAVLHHFNGLAEVLAAALHVAALEHHAVVLDGLEHGVRLCDGGAQRLFAVNVLLRLGRIEHGQAVPMVRRGHDHRVHILVLDDLAEIVHDHGLGRLLAEHRLDALLNVRDAQVAQHDRLEVAVHAGELEVGRAHAAEADVAGADNLIRAEHRGGQN